MSQLTLTIKNSLAYRALDCSPLSGSDPSPKDATTIAPGKSQSWTCDDSGFLLNCEFKFNEVTSNVPLGIVQYDVGDTFHMNFVFHETADSNNCIRTGGNVIYRWGANVGTWDVQVGFLKVSCTRSTTGLSVDITANA